MIDSAIIGWREWVNLPDLGVPRIKAKIDTGARSSSLHAQVMDTYRRDGRNMVRFRMHPMQRDSKVEIVAEAPLIGHRSVRTSSGIRSLRPVIETEVVLMGARWPIELTLTRRDAMGFRMLLGRQAVRGRFLIDPGTSFLGRRAKKISSTSKGPSDS